MSEDGIERDGLKPGDGVVVTGGGGGFGRAFSKRFGRMGARVAVWDIDAGRGGETVAQVKAAGGEARFYKVDLANAADIEACVAATLADQGAPYCLVNNASVFPRGEVVELSLAA